MDISVTQLNHRLALQLPAELPLGLVFVAGFVRHVTAAEGVQEGNGRVTLFDLEHNGHRLRCKLAPREADRVIMHDGDEVRLGGHLAFDAQRAQYFLLARDVEVIAGQAPEADPLAIDLNELVGDEAAFTAALVDIKRRANVARHSPEQLPGWVQKIAPPEMQNRMAQEEISQAATPSAARTAPPPQRTPLNEELVSFLSAAMESEEDIELTPGVLAQWQMAPAVAPSAAGAEEITAPAAAAPEPAAAPDNSEQPSAFLQPYDPVGDSVVQSAPMPAAPLRTPSRRPPAIHRTDWLVTVLIVSMVILTIAICVIGVLLALR